MPQPRYSQVSLDATPFYHCVSRTVRRAFLCGQDHYSGQCYEHRRGWIEQRLLQLTQAFAIDIAAYAVMSNHLHVVLRVDASTAQAWSSLEVVKQWQLIFKGTLLSQKFAKGEPIVSYELDTLKSTIAEYRRRLFDISWFMRALSEPVARQANKEDDCTGRFWEGRFKSQALLDDAAVLACMTYVDLNPIRAKVAKTPEQSDFTSIQRRIKAALNGEQPKRLLAFVGNEQHAKSNELTMEFKDYLTLVDDTARVIQDAKRSVIQPETAATLHRLNIPLENWLKVTHEFKYLFTGPVGNLQALTEYSEGLGKKRIGYASSCRHWQRE